MEEIPTINQQKVQDIIPEKVLDELEDEHLDFIKQSYPIVSNNQEEVEVIKIAEELATGTNTADIPKIIENLRESQKNQPEESGFDVKVDQKDNVVTRPDAIDG